MPNTRSAIKRARKNAGERLRNRSVRSNTKTLITKARQLIQSGDLEQADGAIREAQRALARSAQKGVIKSNNAAGRTSRLVKQRNVAQAIL